MPFHVPECSRDVTHPILGSTSEDGNNGAFLLESPEPGWLLAIIASDGSDWEHVSIHAYRVSSRERDGTKVRTPNWKEMVYVKDVFWDEEDIVMQLHPKKSEYVNCHPHTLHLWRPTNQMIPTPPAELVGPRQTVAI